MRDVLDVYTGDPVAAEMFVALVNFVARQPDMVAQFEAETGKHMPAPARTPLDAMIDQACGANEDYVMAFARWVHDTMWAGDTGDDQ